MIAYKFVHGNTDHVLGDDDGSVAQLAYRPLWSILDAATHPETEKMVPETPCSSSFLLCLQCQYGQWSRLVRRVMLRRTGAIVLGVVLFLGLFVGSEASWKGVSGSCVEKGSGVSSSSTGGDGFGGDKGVTRDESFSMSLLASRSSKEGRAFNRGRSPSIH